MIHPYTLLYMKREFLRYCVCLTFVVSCTSFLPVKNTFTGQEMQSIQVPTPGLFDRSDEIQIDLSAVSPTDYCFPLPVGKAEMADGGDALEIHTTKGDAVKAMFAGVVRLSKNYPPFGPTIVVRHENGLETVYSNNAQNLVKVGQEVKAGQTIAIVGTEQDKTFCLFSVMINGRRMNPATLLELNSHRLHPQIINCRKEGERIKITTQRRTNATALMPDNPFEKSTTFELNLAQLNDKQWAYPLPGAKVISPFGGKRRHGGVDLKTKPNDNIVAAFDGEVTLSGPYYGYGNCIRIKHACGLETLYGHQSKNLVKKGDKVKAGQVIGLTGRTGRATTEHLHFELFFQGRRYDPATIFDHTNRRLKNVTLTMNKNGNISAKTNK